MPGDEEDDGNGAGAPPLTRDDVVSIVRDAFKAFKPENSFDQEAFKKSLLDDLKAASTEDTEDTQTTKTPSKGQDPAYQGLKDQLEALKAQNAAAEAKLRADTLKSTVQSALIAGKAAPERVDVALAYLVSNELVTYSDEGQLVYAGTDEWGQPSHKPVEKGVEEFLASDTGKMFLPARPVQGTGAGPGDPYGVVGGRTLDPENATRAALSQLMSARFTE